MGDKPPLYDHAIYWLALGGFLALIGAFLAQPSLDQVIAHPNTATSNGSFVVGAVLMALGILAAWWSLTLFMAHRHAAWHLRHATQGVPAGSVTHNTTTYNAPVYYGVAPPALASHPVPGGVTFDAADAETATAGETATVKESPAQSDQPVSEETE